MQGLCRKNIAQGCLPGRKSSSSSSGTTNLGSIARRPQYRVLIRHSSGAEHIESTFLTRNSRGEVVMSARAPTIKVKVARARPMIVRYWKCQP